MKRRGKYLDFAVKPMPGWTKSKHGKQLIRETKAVARHLDLAMGKLA